MNKQVNKDLERYGKAVLRSDIMRKAFKQRHHLRSTVGDHTMRVARASVRLGRTLEKLHVRVNMRAVVIGSLCHDLGIIGRKEKYSSVMECYKKHPSDSVEVAKELLDELPEKIEDIIQSHMWPLRLNKRPGTIEGFIVSAADKYASVEDLIKGRSRKKRARFVKRKRGKNDGKR